MNSSTGLLRVDGRRNDQLRPVKVTRNFIKHAEDAAWHFDEILFTQFVFLAEHLGYLGLRLVCSHSPDRIYGCRDHRVLSVISVVNEAFGGADRKPIHSRCHYIQRLPADRLLFPLQACDA